MCRYFLIKALTFRLRSWMIFLAVVSAIFAVAGILYFLIMFIWDIVRVAQGDYIWQMMPNRKLVRNYLYEQYRYQFYQLCLFNPGEGIDHTFEAAPMRKDKFDDDDDYTDAALGPHKLMGRSMLKDPDSKDDTDEDEINLLPDKLEDRPGVKGPVFKDKGKAVNFFQGANIGGERAEQDAPPSKADGDPLRPAIKKMGFGVFGDGRLARYANDYSRYGEECLNITDTENQDVKQDFNETFGKLFNRAEKRFSGVMIFIDLVMLILNIVFLVTCYCLIVSIRRKSVNIAIPWVVLAGICICLNPAYWVIRLAFTPPWGYFNITRIVLTFIFLLLFWGVFFFAVYILGVFFLYCFLVELDPTSPLVIQSDMDQKAMKHEIEN